MFGKRRATPRRISPTKTEARDLTQNNFARLRLHTRISYHVLPVYWRLSELPSFRTQRLLLAIQNIGRGPLFSLITLTFGEMLTCFDVQGGMRLLWLAGIYP